MEFWLWMPQLFACTRARIKTQINRGLSPTIPSFLIAARACWVSARGRFGLKNRSTKVGVLLILFFS